MASHVACLDFPVHTALKGCHFSPWPQPHLTKSPKEEAVRFRGSGLRNGEGKEIGCSQKWPRDG